MKPIGRDRTLLVLAFAMGFMLCMALMSGRAHAQMVCESVQSGSWGDWDTWNEVDCAFNGPNTYRIRNGHTVTAEEWDAENVEIDSLTIDAGGALFLDNGYFSASGPIVVSGTLTFGQSYSIYTYLNSVTINAGGTWDMAEQGTVVHMSGNLTNNGTFIPGWSDYAFYGESTIVGVPAFWSLAIYEKVTIESDVTVTGYLTIGSGGWRIVTGTSAKVIIPSGSSISNPGPNPGYVAGRLQKFVPAGSAAVTFEVGTDGASAPSLAYSPVTLAFSGVGTGGGSLIASATLGDHPNIASSDLDPSKSVNRWWTATTTGVTGTPLPAFTSYNATFNFVAGDVDAGANTANFTVDRWSGSAWSTTTNGTRTSTSTQATGITALGQYAVAEKGATPPALSMYYIHADHLNTPRLIANATQQTLWRHDQAEPFGTNAPNENPSGLGPFEFPLRDAGTYADKETNLVYNWNRYRDIDSGRFIQADPLGLKGGDLSLYALRKNNPLTYLDPTGLVNWKGTFGGLGYSIGGGGAVFGYQLTSECKCGQRVTITGFASALTAGLSLKPGSVSGSGAEFYDYLDCPDPGIANGLFAMSSANLVLGTGPGYSKIQLGGLRSYNSIGDQNYGFDVSIGIYLGSSAVTDAKVECCSK